MKKIIPVIAMIVLAGSVVAIYMATRSLPAPAIPAYRDLVATYKPSDIVLKDRNNMVIHELRVDLHGRALEWVALPHISPALIEAVIVSEDRRFRTHNGSDWRALANALLQYLQGGKKRGASTISMQLANIIDPGLQGYVRKKRWQGKLLQIRAAIAMEQSWSKDQILEAYLNLVSFRGELEGIRAASTGLFYKEPSGLTQIESLILASLIRAPNAAAPALERRIKSLAGALNWQVPAIEVAHLLSERLGQPYKMRMRASLAPHVARQLAHSGSTVVRCTLDGELQAFASTVLREYLAGLKTKNVADGAVLIADNKTGQILAYVGNGGIYSSAPFVDGIRAKRQAGSTLKPFLYALAFDLKLLTAGSLISDSPIDLYTERGIYRPANYDNSYKGPVSARIALASSLNIPAVRAILLTGEDRFVETLRHLGFTGLHDSEHYGYSLALGTIDVSLYELVQAYLALANGGVHSRLFLVLPHRQEQDGMIFSKQASFIVSDILSDREARSITFGLENPLSTPFWAAVKTGTSKDMRDNWCIGYSRRFTVGVWVGNFSGAPMWNVSGVSGAGPIWQEIMRHLHRSLPSLPPSPPAGISIHRVSREDGLSVQKEWFIEGTRPLTLGETRKIFAAPSIIYPAPGTIIAIDPDIPGAAQKMIFEASPDTGHILWLLNGTHMGQGPTLSWKPEAGHHSLCLVDSEGRILDEVAFTVRK